MTIPYYPHFLSEKRLRPIASIKDKHTQLEQFKELIRDVGIEESIHKTSI